MKNKKKNIIYPLSIDKLLNKNIYFLFYNKLVINIHLQIN